MEFEWDAGKARSNWDKHSVSFDEAVSTFGDFAALLIDDYDHSDQEDRSILIGNSSFGRVIVVSYTIRTEAVRLISAREATPAERRQYAEQKS